MNKKKDLKLEGIVRLSTGACVNMQTSTFDSLDNLIGVIVDEHFKTILTTAMEDGDYSRGAELLYDEISHIVENELVDYKTVLKQALHTLAISRLIYILEHIEEESPELFVKTESSNPSNLLQ